jgi:glycosyltransferase involved in cell wall biosynthesis
MLWQKRFLVVLIFQIMKIAIVTSSVSRNAGGLFDAVRGLAQQLPPLGVVPHVYGLMDSYTEDDRGEWSPIGLTAVKSIGPRSIGYSPGMREQLMRSGAALVHTHGIWMYPSANVVAWRRKFGRPYIISPHGMLDRWILNRSKIKKMLALSAYEGEHLKGAACFHALNQDEANSIRALGYRQPIAILPNGVNIPRISANVRPSWWSEDLAGKRLLLYFGRLHSKKGIDNLLVAWRSLSETGQLDQQLTLVVGGWGEGAYVEQLHKILDNRQQDFRVKFIGSQFGEDKVRTYAACDAVVLPSFSEGLPLVPLEAWAVGVPCALTKECNLPEAFERGAAIEISSDVNGLREFIKKFGTVDISELQVIGERGFSLVAEKFVWSSIAEKMAFVYRWLLGDGDRPDFIVDE